MAFVPSLFAHGKREKECCSLQDTLNGNVTRCRTCWSQGWNLNIHKGWPYLFLHYLEIFPPVLWCSLSWKSGPVWSTGNSGKVRSVEQKANTLCGNLQLCSYFLSLCHFISAWNRCLEFSEKFNVFGNEYIQWCRLVCLAVNWSVIVIFLFIF